MEGWAPSAMDEVSCRAIQDASRFEAQQCEAPACWGKETTFYHQQGSSRWIGWSCEWGVFTSWNWPNKSVTNSPWRSQWTIFISLLLWFWFLHGRRCGKSRSVHQARWVSSLAKQNSSWQALCSQKAPRHGPWELVSRLETDWCSDAIWLLLCFFSEIQMASFLCDSFLVSNHHVQADVSTSLYVAQVLDLLLAHVMGTWLWKVTQSGRRLNKEHGNESSTLPRMCGRNYAPRKKKNSMFWFDPRMIYCG